MIGWVGILGQWWCHGCGGGWLSFGPAIFVAIVGRQCLLKILSFFFFLFSFLLRFLDLEFVGGPVIVVVVCGGGCSSGSWFLVGGDYHEAMCLYIVGF